MYALPDIAIFVVATALIIVGALGVITLKNPVHSAISLIGTLIGVAIAFIEQDAQFLAAVQVIVYAGAIVVLFLFVIMFLGVDRREDVSVEPLVRQRSWAAVTVALTVGSVIALMAKSHWATGAHQVTGDPGSGNTNVAHIGTTIFTTYLYAFEVTSALLIIAVVGAVILARRSNQIEESAR
jgi:NADH-quinone oxidoreductase subunit J